LNDVSSSSIHAGKLPWFSELKQRGGNFPELGVFEVEVCEPCRLSEFFSKGLNLGVCESQLNQPAELSKPSGQRASEDLFGAPEFWLRPDRCV